MPSYEIYCCRCGVYIENSSEPGNKLCPSCISSLQYHEKIKKRREKEKRTEIDRVRRKYLGDDA